MASVSLCNELLPHNADGTAELSPIMPDGDDLGKAGNGDMLLL